MTIELHHDPLVPPAGYQGTFSASPEAFYPLRPSSIHAEAEFFQPGHFSHYPNLAPMVDKNSTHTFKVIGGDFSNPIAKKGSVSNRLNTLPPPYSSNWW